MNEILIIGIGFFVLVQLINGIFNILIASNLKKIAIGQSKIRDEEVILLAQQWENILIKFEEIREKFEVLEVKIDRISEDVFDAYIQQSDVKKKRGPYKPRRLKEIGHKKTPPEF